ncbi:MAG: zinc ribbon domain-containing protein [Clostridia bacterium]|nr:zinc ribbon domain-containing protein [Clostridia bacterium]
MENKKPIAFLIFKILGFLGVALAIAAMALAILGFGDFESNNFMIGSILFPVGTFVGIFGLVFGFRPEIARLNAKTAKYVQSEIKDDLADIATANAEINAQAVTTIAKSVKDGIEDSMFCKYCGAKIDADSAFCKKCGKQQ